MFLNSINYEITCHDEMSFKIKFKILFNKLIIIILKTNIFNKVNILINPRNSKFCTKPSNKDG
jgi:hypothetical protein